MKETDKKTNRNATKLAIVVVLVWIALFGMIFKCDASDKKHLPFAGKTKHKTVKKMTKRQVRKAQKGKTFYYRNKKGKIKKRI
jgi:hypothetical protein